MIHRLHRGTSLVRAGQIRSWSLRSAAFGCLLLFLSLVPIPVHAGNWYVSDTSTTEDYCTYAAGSDTHTGAPAEPLRDIEPAMRTAGILADCPRFVGDHKFSVDSYADEHPVPEMDI